MLDDIGRTEEMIIFAKQEWERTFDSIPDLIAILDKDYRIARVNNSMARVLGVEPAELVGKTCYKIIHGTKQPPAECPHTKLCSDGCEHTNEIYEEQINKMNFGGRKDAGN